MIRLMVFHDRPDCMAVFVHDYDGPQTLVIEHPLTRERVREAARTAGVEVRISEATYVGRLRPVFDRMLMEQRGERHQQQREREAAKVVGMRMSGDSFQVARAQLLKEKTDVDDELRRLKTELGNAKSRAFERGVYLPPAEFRKKENRVEALKERSLAIQFELGQLRRLPRPVSSTPSEKIPANGSGTPTRRPGRLAKSTYTEQLIYHVGRLIEDRLGRSESEDLFKIARERINTESAVGDRP